MEVRKKKNPGSTVTAEGFLLRGAQRQTRGMRIPHTFSQGQCAFQKRVIIHSHHLEIAISEAGVTAF